MVLTSLFFTQLIFVIITLFIQKKEKQFLIIGLLYLLAHFESHLFKKNDYSFYFPLAADTALITLSYFSFGFYAKSFISELSFKKALPFILISSASTVLYAVSQFDFQYELKYIDYTNLLLDWIIPVSFGIAIIWFSQLLEKYKVGIKNLEKVGNNSLLIMYTHFPINLTMGFVFDAPPVFLITLGIVIPMVANRLIIRKSPTLELFFLGKQNMNIENKVKRA